MEESDLRSRQKTADWLIVGEREALLGHALVELKAPGLRADCVSVVLNGVVCRIIESVKARAALDVHSTNTILHYVADRMLWT